MPRRQQKQKKVKMKSDWSTDSDDRKDIQARMKPDRHGITSYWDTEMEDDQHILVNAPLSRPIKFPKY